MQCVNRNTREYQTLKKRSGLPDFVLSAKVGRYLEELGRYPYLDELPGANSEPTIIEDLHLNKKGATDTTNILEATNSETIEEAIPKLNDKYRDKEIEVLEMGDRSKVYITERPSTLSSKSSSIEEKMQIEIADIKAKAIANGTFMKAPNGNPTNLNEDLWLLVRTSVFKDWFGDWENDSDNASKVVDENGEPLVVYHTSDVDFTVFDLSKRNSKDPGYYGKGFYFYTKPSNLGLENPVIKSYFLNLRTPLIQQSANFSNTGKELPTNNDGSIVRYNDSDSENIVEDIDQITVSNPNQIKSATLNTNEFSKNIKEKEDSDINNFEDTNSFLYLNLVLEKLLDLYGINIIHISNAELASSDWDGIVGVLGVKAFVYQGNIYVNTDIATIDSPLHEMLHILFGSMKFLNRELYEQLISSALSFALEIAPMYPNRTREDIYEEAFITELAKYLTNQHSALDSLDPKIKNEIFYNVTRTLDSILMGKSSVKCISERDLYRLNLKTLAKIINSVSMVSDFNGTLNNAALNRILANKKQDLMEKGLLREECS